jgi:hypothetical protein
MKTYHPENERIKRAYFNFLKEAKGMSEASIDAAAKAIARFESYTRWKSFKVFHVDQAAAFKRHLAAQIGQRSGEPLSKATLRQTLAALKAFVEWLSGELSYKVRIAYSDAAYFSRNRAIQDARQLRTKFSKSFPIYFCGASTIHFFPRPKSLKDRTGNSKPLESTVRVGAMRTCPQNSSVTLSLRRACPISTRNDRVAEQAEADAAMAGEAQKP